MHVVLYVNRPLALSNFKQNLNGLTSFNKTSEHKICENLSRVSSVATSRQIDMVANLIGIFFATFLANEARKYNRPKYRVLK
jgi:hypothetical protein